MPKDENRGDADSITPYSYEGDSFSSVGNTAYQLNAATNYTPTAGTKITTWSNTGSNTQRWDMHEYFPGTSYKYMKNAYNKNVVICYNGSAQAILTTISYSNAAKDTQGIRLVNEGIGSLNSTMYGLVLPAYLKAMTATSYYDGAQVQWQGPNGLNNQLWYIALYF